MSQEKENMLPHAVYNGMVDIADFKIRCYNLNTGERVLSREGILRALGRTGNPKYKEEVEDGTDVQLFQTPVFLRAENLKPFISNDLITSSQPIVFETDGKRKAYGYRAELLPQICYVYVDAEKAGVLSPKQKIVAERCHILIRGFATVGIIALVDEATGYQYTREKDELQKILKAYISPELLPWQKRFPDVFYKELFRLNGWDFTVNGIKNRPGVIGTWTKKLVYEQLPKGVLDKLKEITPKSESGNYTHRLHQSLTIDVGEPNLTAQINQVVTLFLLSDNMEDMWGKFRKLLLRQSGQLEIPFAFDEKGHTKEPLYDETKVSDFNQKLKTALNYNPKDKAK